MVDPGSELPAGLITYLFTDVEGSTSLWQQHPDEMKNVMARHDSLLTSAFEESGGTVVRPRGEGDSIFAVFPAPQMPWVLPVPPNSFSCGRPGREALPSTSAWLCILVSLSYATMITTVTR